MILRLKYSFVKILISFLVFLGRSLHVMADSVSI